MKYFTLFLIPFLIFFSSQSVACSCDASDPFMTVYRNTKFVALVKVISHTSMLTMEVEVIDTYKGTENRKRITIWGDNGFLCRPYVSEFQDNSYYIVALFEGNPKSGNFGETASDYTISVCGEYWLSVNYEWKVVRGKIAKRKREMKLDKLKAKLTSG